MRHKRIVFWICLAVSAGVAAWWATYVPYDPQRLYRAIPNNAWWVSEHDALADRWEDTVRSPLLDALPGAVGIDAQRRSALLHDPVVGAAVARLARRKVVLAGVPWLGESARPAWVGAAWVGLYGQCLRWGFVAPWIEGLERVALEDGWRGWAWTDPGLDGRTLSLAVVDGMLLGCLSEDPRGVQVLIDRLQRGAPIVDALRERQRESAADRVWFRWADGSAAGSGPHSVEIAVTESGAAGWHGWMTGTALHMLADDPSNGDPERRSGPVPVHDLDTRLDALARLLDDAPEAIAVVPSAVGESLMDRPVLTRAARETAATLLERADSAGLGFVALFSGPYSGRMLGIRVPSVMLGVCLADEANGLNTVSESLDRINAARGWGLIPRSVRVGGLDAVVVDSSRGGVYGSLGDAERLVLTVVDGWFVVCSSVRTLERLASERAQRPAAAPASAWAAGVRAAGGQEYLWLDPGAAGDAVKKALAAYSLVRLVQRGGDRDVLRERLDLLHACVEYLAPIQAAELWMARDRPEPALRFRLSTVPDDGA
jgi:hypothetical protein